MEPRLLSACLHVLQGRQASLMCTTAALSDTKQCVSLEACLDGCLAAGYAWNVTCWANGP